MNKKPISFVSPPIRLTYVITDLNMGGVPLHLYRLVKVLPSDRFRIRVISLAERGPVGAMLGEIGIPVLSCRARSQFDASALWRLWKYLCQEPSDLVHSFLFHANVATRIVCLLAGIPTSRLVCEIQTAEQERLWHLIVDNLSCRLCLCEVGNSASVIEHLHRYAHIPKSRLRCELGAVDVDVFASARPLDRKSLGIPDDIPMIVWTGRLDPVKGFEEMLAAVSQVCAVQPVIFVLVGEGPYRTNIECLIRDLGLEKNVILLGQRSDIPSLLKAADIFLLGSRTEGMPNSLLEAMASGLPIVATDVAGCRDLIDGDRTGLLARAGVAEDIALKLLSLLKNQKKAVKLGKEAQSWVREHMDIRQWGRRWISYYESIS